MLHDKPTKTERAIVSETPRGYERASPAEMPNERERAEEERMNFDAIDETLIYLGELAEQEAASLRDMADNGGGFVGLRDTGGELWAVFDCEDACRVQAIIDLAEFLAKLKERT